MFNLSDIEKHTVDAVDAQMPSMIALLERLVSIPSSTGNANGLELMSQTISAELNSLGFARLISSDHSHFVSTRQTQEGPRFLLIGHMDTVLDAPCGIDGNIARGGGIADMKGGIVVMVSALRALQVSGCLDRGSFSVWLASDEECPVRPTRASRASLCALAKASDVALGFETGITGTLTIARRGISTWSIRVKAATAHSASIGSERAGYGAIYEAARLVHEMQSMISPAGISINPATMGGGMSVRHSTHDRLDVQTTSGAIASEAELSGDLRYTSIAQQQEALLALRELLATPLRHATSEMTIEDVYPPMEPREETYHLAANYSAASADLGFGQVRPLEHSRRGSGDTCFAAPYTVAIDGLGPFGGNVHTKDEFCQLDSIGVQAKRTAILIARTISTTPIMWRAH